MRNIELLTEIRDIITANPSVLDMGSWSKVTDVLELDDGQKVEVSCGSAQCIAGWAVQREGYKFLVDYDCWDSEDQAYYPTDCVKDGVSRNINKTASKLLGLTDLEAHFLFLDTIDEDAVRVLNGFIAGDDIDAIADSLRDTEEVKF